MGNPVVIFPSLVGRRHGIHRLPNHPLRDIAFGGPTGPQNPADLVAEARDLEPGTQPAAHAPGPALHHDEDRATGVPRALLRDSRLAGGGVRIREFRSLEELAALPERQVVHRTGSAPGNSPGTSPPPARWAADRAPPAARESATSRRTRGLPDAAHRPDPARRRQRTRRMALRAEPGGRSANPRRTRRLLRPHGRPGPGFRVGATSRSEFGSPNSHSRTRAAESPGGNSRPISQAAADQRVTPNLPPRGWRSDACLPYGLRPGRCFR